MTRALPAVLGCLLALTACSGDDTSHDAAVVAGGLGSVRGKVTAGPTCPVERADDPCDPRPVRTSVQALRAAGTIAASAHTDAAGTFVLQLPPGRYTLRAVTTGGMLPRCEPAAVTVTAGVASQADIACDTGIR